MTVCVNLIPFDIVVARRLHRRRRAWIAACVTTAAAAGITTGAVRTSLRDPRGLAEELDRAQARADHAMLELDDARMQLRAAQQRLQAVGGLADRPDWSVLLQVIARCRSGLLNGESISPVPRWGLLTLHAATMDMEKTVIDSVAVRKAPPVPPPAGSPAGTPGIDPGVFFVTVRGRGENQRDITALALRLEESGVFRSVRQGKVQPSRLNDRELLEFEFTCELGPAQAQAGERR